MNVLSRENTQEYLRIVSEMETSVYRQQKFGININQKLKDTENKLSLEWQAYYNVDVPTQPYYDSAVRRFFRGFFGVERTAFEFGKGFGNSFLGVINIFPITVFVFSVAIGIWMIISSVIMETEINFGDEIIKGIIFAFVLTHLLPGLIMLLRTGSVNRQYKEEFNQEERKAWDKKDTYRRNIEALEKRKTHLEKWRSFVWTSFLETKDELEKIYSYDIVYPKYRNFIAMCTIYEYYESQRCDMLIGHEGAYNIYENELRQNIIIGMLDQINTRLDVIERNQHVLAEAIRDTNYRLGALERQVEQVQLTAESAEYSAKVAADNTKYIACLETIRLLAESN